MGRERGWKNSNNRVGTSIFTNSCHLFFSYANGKLLKSAKICHLDDYFSIFRLVGWLFATAFPAMTREVKKQKSIHVWKCEFLSLYYHQWVDLLLLMRSDFELLFFPHSPLSHIDVRSVVRLLILFVDWISKIPTRVAYMWDCSCCKWIKIKKIHISQNRCICTSYNDMTYIIMEKKRTIFLD